MTTTATWGNRYREALQALDSDVDARRIVEEASGYEGREFFRALDLPVPEKAERRFRDMLERRQAGEPLQYVIGRWSFRRLDLFVDRRVLIPRPETEVLVDVALAELPRLDRDPVIVDLGTGSGAIGLSLAVEAPTSRVWATDVSPDAAAVASANSTGIGTRAAPRVRIAEGSWFDALPQVLHGRVAMIVSNPPYIADAEELPPVVSKWEPRIALRAGPTGLEAYDALLAGAPDWLARPGSLVVEVAPHQAVAVVERAEAAGAISTRVHRDLAGRDRVVVARW